MRISAYISFALLCISYQDSTEVTVSQFAAFAEATGYTTTAEQYGWSAVAKSVYEFEVVMGATWRKPDGKHEAKPGDPVTQVSWYDAVAYCKWARAELYTVEQWKAAADWNDEGVTMDNGSGGQIAPAQSNFRGNVWEWCKEGYVLGGSFLCSATTCAGFSKQQYIHIPGKDAGCNNIGFRVK